MTTRVWIPLALLAVAACQPPAPPADQSAAPAAAEPAAGTPDWKIANAMSAAPASLSAGATIMDWPASEGGDFTELRAGTNGWACFPDNPGNPANDPMCLDKVWQAWAAAWIGKKPFSTPVAGIGYMLQSGAVAPGDDPFKMAPGPGEEWMIDPPHLMWIAPNPAALEGLPTEPSGGGPYVMWRGTPYAHVMIPVK